MQRDNWTRRHQTRRERQRERRRDKQNDRTERQPMQCYSARLFSSCAPGVRLHRHQDGANAACLLPTKPSHQGPLGSPEDYKHGGPHTRTPTQLIAVNVAQIKHKNKNNKRKRPNTKSKSLQLRWSRHSDGQSTGLPGRTLSSRKLRAIAGTFAVDLKTNAHCSRTRAAERR